MLRIVGHPYRAADLMLEGSFLLGLLGGRVVGPLGGSIISLPAFFNHEWLSTPVAAAAGLVGGLIRQAIPNTEEIWKLGPVHVSEHPALAGAAVPQGESELGNAAARGLCRFGAGAPGAGSCHQAAVAFLSGRGTELGVGIGVALHGDGGRRSDQDLEQHADRDESRAVTSNCCSKRAWTPCPLKSIPISCSTRSIRFHR